MTVEPSSAAPTKFVLLSIVVVPLAREVYECRRATGRVRQRHGTAAMHSMTQRTEIRTHHHPRDHFVRLGVRERDSHQPRQRERARVDVFEQGHGLSPMGASLRGTGGNPPPSVMGRAVRRGALRLAGHVVPAEAPVYLRAITVRENEK